MGFIISSYLVHSPSRDRDWLYYIVLPCRKTMGSGLRTALHLPSYKCFLLHPSFSSFLNISVSSNSPGWTQSNEASRMGVTDASVIEHVIGLDLRIYNPKYNQTDEDSVDGGGGRRSSYMVSTIRYNSSYYLTFVVLHSLTM